jgi:hypothetical protein
MGRWALLKHTLPDRTWHYDWLLDASGHPDAALLTFRTVERPDEPAVHAFDAERIADHRRVYLQYEGDITGNRGRVERVAAGECEVELPSPIIRVTLCSDEPTRKEITLIGTPQEASGIHYRFQRT